MTITVTQKEFSFKIDDYEVDHQGGAILDIGVNLKYRKKAGDEDPQDYLEFQVPRWRLLMINAWFRACWVLLDSNTF